MSTRKLIPWFVFTDKDTKRGKVFTQFTSSGGVETLSLAINGLQITVPYEEVYKVIKEERSKVKKVKRA